MKTDLFPELIPTMPDMRRFRDMLGSVKTAICGRKRYCELSNVDCPVYCVKTGANPSELNGKDILL